MISKPSPLVLLSQSSLNPQRTQQFFPTDNSELAFPVSRFTNHRFRRRMGVQSSTFSPW